MLHLETVLFLTTALFFLLPLLIWWSTTGAQDKGVLVWCSGSLLAGLGLVLLSVRPWVPVWVGYHLANVCVLMCFMLWAQSLRTMLGHPWAVRTLVVCFFLIVAYYSALYQWGEPAARGVGMRLANACQAGLVAYLAWQLGKRSNSLNAKAIAVAYLLLGLGIGLVLLLQGGGGSQPSPFSATWDARAIALVALATSAVAHLCYAGLVLDRAAHLRLKSLQAQWAAKQTAQRDAELQAAENRTQTVLLAASLSHDLNQPLALASGHAQGAQRVLQADRLDAPMLGASLEKAATALARCNQVLDRVRSAGKARSLAFELLDLRLVAQGAVDLLKTEQHPADVQLAFAAEGAALGCLGNELALSQVLMNLLRDSFKAMGMGVPPRCVVECGGDQQRVWVRLRGSPQTDAPDGPSPAQAPLGSRPPLGRSVGFAISQILIRQHSGRLKWRYLPQGGTEAMLELPRWPEAV